jgi:lipoprotein-releasing system ATP-binding protein
MNKKIQPASVLQCEHLAKTFHDGALHVEVLSRVNLAVKPAERIAIVGKSGSGKSTLLHLLGGLDTPTSGKIYIAGREMSALSDAERSRVRNQYLGFVYQFHHLLPEFTALENVCIPLLLRNLHPDEAKEKANHLLTRVGLAKRVDHKLGELSGGERQRTALARALVTDPVCVLADEPTGNLDQKTAANVYELMLELNSVLGTSFVIVTHDPKLAQKMQRTLVLENGVLNEVEASDLS